MKSTEVIQTTVEKILSAIQSPFYETQVKTIRQLKAQGKQAEADETFEEVCEKTGLWRS